MQSFAHPTNSSSQLPPELVFHILTEAWEAPQSVDKRSALFRNICMVNHTWLGLFVRVALRHAHLPCSLGAEGFLRLLTEHKGDVDTFTEAASQVANEMCRSITFHANSRAQLEDDSHPPEIKLYSENDVATNAISNVLYMVSVLDRLPNLRQIALRYIDWGYDDIFDQLRTTVFPSQVTHLSIEYAFSPSALEPLARYLKSVYTPQRCPRVMLPSVRHLSVSGVPTEFVADMLQVCTGAETVQMTNPTRLHILAPLPPSVHTLVLFHPAALLDKEEMIWWTLNTAMESGLFSCAVKPRVVVRSGTPDPVTFMAVKRNCKASGVDFVYERGDVAIC